MTKSAMSRFFLKKTKKTLFGAVIGLILVSGAGLGWLFFPLELAEFDLRYEFWRDGVHEIQIQETHGYLRDSCSPGKVAQHCACVALIHGLGDNAFTWKKILQWPESNWKQLGVADPMRLFAVNLPGSGLSPRPQDLSQYQARKLANRLAGILGTLCNQWVVVGNSFGGWVAAWLALDHSEEVTRLVLLAPGGMKRLRENGSLLERPTVETMKEFQRKAYYRPREISERVWKEIVIRAQDSPVNDIKKAQVPEDDLDLKLPSIRQPTLMLWGVADQIIPLSIGQEMRSLKPSTIWKQVPECGHLPQKECPAAVVQSIVDMINFGAV